MMRWVFPCFLFAVTGGYEIALRRCWSTTTTFGTQLHNADVRARWQERDLPAAKAALIGARALNATLAVGEVLLLIHGMN